jgi:HEPN domain-containing protein
VDRKDLQALSQVRAREAQGLLSLGLYDGAYYLAGYAIECALKACIAKSTRRYEFPDRTRVDASYTHELPKLLKLAGLDKMLEERATVDPEFREAWRTVLFWSEQSRYQRYGAEAAAKLVEAVADRKHGVMTWIKLHW